MMIVMKHLKHKKKAMMMTMMTKKKRMKMMMNRSYHLLAANRAPLTLLEPETAAMRIRLIGSRAIGTCTLPDVEEGFPQVRLMYTLRIKCSLNCSARQAWECSSYDQGPQITSIT